MWPMIKSSERQNSFFSSQYNVVKEGLYYLLLGSIATWNDIARSFPYKYFLESEANPKHKDSKENYQDEAR